MTRLYDWLKGRGMSQKFFAKKIGVSLPTMSRMVHGESVSYSLAKLVQWETGGDVKVEDQFVKRENRGRKADAATN